MKLGVIFGSKSLEHDVSIVSASSIINNLNKEKYEIFPIYLDKDNNWYEVKHMDIKRVGDLPDNIISITNPIKYLKELDVIFPVLHGKYGEDGTIQGMLQLLNIPYIGCGIMASSVCLDKLYTKTLLSNHLPVVNDIAIYIKDGTFYRWNKGILEEKLDFAKIDKLIKDSFGYPVFIKPSRYGSSVGVQKTLNKEELIKGLNSASKYDSEILIEKSIVGRELECAILNGKALAVGEVISAENFYSYDAKYKNEDSLTIIPAKIKKDIELEIKKMAESAFSIINGKGLARIDFFLEDKTNQLFINEINTMPGFTNISMYPKLAQEANISYEELLDILITDAKKESN